MNFGQKLWDLLIQILRVICQNLQLATWKYQHLWLFRAPNLSNSWEVINQNAGMIEYRPFPKSGNYEFIPVEFSDNFQFSAHNNNKFIYQFFYFLQYLTRVKLFLLEGIK